MLGIADKIQNPFLELGVEKYDPFEAKLKVVPREADEPKNVNLFEILSGYREITIHFQFKVKEISPDYFADFENPKDIYTDVGTLVYGKTKVKKTENESGLEGRVEKTSLTKGELAKESFKALIIAGVGTGAVATYFFDYKIGLAVGALSTALSVYSVFYRNNHYSDYY